MTDFSAQPSKVAGKITLYKVVLPLLIILMAAIVFAIMMFSASEPAKKPVDNKPPLVEVLPLNQEDITFVIASQGTVVPARESQLMAQVSGKITLRSEQFYTGKFVKKGALLAQIEQADYQISVQQAEARLEQANANLLEEQARAKQAKEEWQLTGKPLKDAPVLALRTPQLRKANAELTLAQAELEAAQLKLSRTNIYSPYDGIIQNVAIEQGQFVNLGSAIGGIFSVDKAEVRLPIKQQDIPFLNLPKLNQQPNEPTLVALSIDVAGRTQQWQGKIVRYEGQVDATSRVHYLIAEINDPYNLAAVENKTELRMGSFVQANVQGKKFEQISKIPRRYVIGKNTLYLMAQNHQLHIQTFSHIRGDQEYLYSQDNFVDGLQLVITELALPVNDMPLRVANKNEQIVSLKLGQ